MSDGDDLLKVVKQDNKTIIDNIRGSKSLGGCDSCQPIKEGQIRSIVLLEMVLERDIANSVAIERNHRASADYAFEDRGDAMQDRSDAITSAANFVQWGKLKAAGIPAMIFAGILAMMVFQYMQGEKIKTDTREVIAQQLKLVSKSL